MAKQKWKKIIGWTVATLIVIVAIWHNAPKPEEADKDRLIVATNIPLTGAGSAFMKGVPNALKMGARDELNRLGLSQESIVFNIQDNKTSPQTALSIYRLHEMRGFDVYFVGLTNEIEAIAPALNKTNKPHFYDVFGTATMKRGNWQTLRILCNMKMEKEVLKSFIERKNAQNLVFFALNNTTYNEEWNFLVKPLCAEMGITCSSEFFEPRENDFHTIVYKLKQRNPDVIFVAGFGWVFYQALMELYTQELVHDNVIAPLNFLTFINEKNIDNHVKSAFYFMADASSIPGKSEKSEQFKKAYEKEFGTKPIYNDAYAYDTGVLLARAFAKHGKHLKAKDIVAETPYEGASGMVILDPKTRDLISDYLFARVNDKGVVEEVKLK